MQRLRTVTSLDVSAVAGHHAMPAALLLCKIQCKLYKNNSHMHAPSTKCIFLAFFMKVYFLALKKVEKKILKMKKTAIFFYQFVLNILYCRLYDLKI